MAGPAVTSTDTSTVTSTSTVTTSANSLLYIPSFMYYTATTNQPFYQSLTPITHTAPDASTFSEVSNSDNSTSISITSASSTYYDLGGYYVYGPLSFFTTHNITISGTGFAVNLWLNPQSWNWAGNTFTNLGSDGSYGLGTTTGTITIGSSTTFDNFLGICSGSYTITQLIGGSCAGITGTTTFAIWVGITSTSIGTTSATITQVSSAPFP